MTQVSQPTLLMCPPDLYQVDYVINPWMQGNLGAASQARAQQQWTKLHAILSTLADVLLVTPQPGSPDMVFTANAGLVHQGKAILSSFHHPERQAEEQHFRTWFAHAGYDIVDLPRSTPFEGEGDALFSASGDCLWVGHGARTNLASHDALRRIWPVDVVSLRLVDPRFYHLDTCFAPLEDGSLLYYPPAFDAPSLARIESFYTPQQRIAVGESDALAFSCNAVNLGRTIVCNSISPGLEADLQARGFQVLQTPMDEFLKAGGAAKCLVLKLPTTMHLKPQARPYDSPNDLPGDEHVRTPSEVCLV